MKNIVKRIVIEIEEIEDKVQNPYEIEGYYELTPDDQIALEELSPCFWEQFIADCLSTRAMDNHLAKLF